MAKKKYCRADFKDCEPYVTDLKFKDGTYKFVSLAPAKSKAKTPLMLADEDGVFVGAVKIAEVLEIIEPPYSHPTGVVTPDKLRKAKARETYFKTSGSRSFMYLGQHPDNSSRFLYCDCAHSGIRRYSTASSAYSATFTSGSSYTFSPLTTTKADDTITIIANGKETVISTQSAHALNLI